VLGRGCECTLARPAVLNNARWSERDRRAWRDEYARRPRSIVKPMYWPPESLPRPRPARHYATTPGAMAARQAAPAPASGACRQPGWQRRRRWNRPCCSSQRAGPDDERVTRYDGCRRAGGAALGRAAMPIGRKRFNGLRAGGRRLAGSAARFCAATSGRAACCAGIARRPAGLRSPRASPRWLH